MPFIHLVEILQGFVGNTLVGVGQAGCCSGNTPRLHIQELVTGANMQSDFAVLCAFLHIVPTYILWTVRNTKSDYGSIEHLGKTFFLGAIGGGPVIRHLAKKIRRVRTLIQILFLLGLTVPKTPMEVFQPRVLILRFPTPYGLRPTAKYDSDTTCDTPIRMIRANNVSKY
jgi:hypothetical protein